MRRESGTCFLRVYRTPTGNPAFSWIRELVQEHYDIYHIDLIIYIILFYSDKRNDLDNSLGRTWALLAHMGSLGMRWVQNCFYLHLVPQRFAVILASKTPQLNGLGIVRSS